MSTVLRQKFNDHMEFNGLSKYTRKNYISAVRGLAEHYNQSPDKLKDEEIRKYLRHLLMERKLAWGSCKNYLAGITYFYRHICERKVNDRFGLPPRPRGRKLPNVLSMEEVGRLLSCIDNLKHRVILKTIYSAGLRVGEATRLKPEHIESDSSRMTIRVEQGKGRKDRYTILSERLLPELREYWRQYSPQHWLFPGQKANTHIRGISVSKILYAAKKSQNNQALQSSHLEAFIRRSHYVRYLPRTYSTMAMISTPSANSLAMPQ